MVRCKVTAVHARNDTTALPAEHEQMQTTNILDSLNKLSLNTSPAERDSTPTTTLPSATPSSAATPSTTSASTSVNIPSAAAASTASMGENHQSVYLVVAITKVILSKHPVPGESTATTTSTTTTTTSTKPKQDVGYAMIGGLHRQVGECVFIM